MAIQDIAAPLHPRHPNRDVECTFALEPAFEALARQALSAGWTSAEVKSAFVMLAYRYGDKRKRGRLTATH